MCFWKDKAIKSEPDCYMYPLAHARYQFYDRRPERTPESEGLFQASDTVRVHIILVEFGLLRGHLLENSSHSVDHIDFSSYSFKLCSDFCTT